MLKCIGKVHLRCKGYTGKLGEIKVKEMTVWLAVSRNSWLHFLALQLLILKRKPTLIA